MGGRDAFHAEERDEANVGWSLSPTASGATSAGRRWQCTRARLAGMLSVEVRSTLTTSRPATKTSLCSGFIVSIITRADRVSNIA